MTPADVLRGARDLIAVPERWCQGAFARDANGFDAWPMPTARDVDVAGCSFCALGAVRYVSPSWHPAVDAELLLDRAAVEVAPELCDGENGSPAANVNDRADHPTVLRMYAVAIALAEQEGPCP